MKKFLAIILLTLTIFTFGCGTKDNSNNNDDNCVPPFSFDENNSSDADCISSATAIYAGFYRDQASKISAGLNIGHYTNLSDYYDETYNNIALVRCIVTIIDKPNDSLGLEVERTPYETIHKVDDFLDDSYDFNKVKKKTDYLTIDTFGSDLDDGTYRVEYDIGVYDENGEVDQAKINCGTDVVWIYVIKTGDSFKLYTPYEWYMRKAG